MSEDEIEIELEKQNTDWLKALDLLKGYSLHLHDLKNLLKQTYGHRKFNHVIIENLEKKEKEINDFLESYLVIVDYNYDNLVEEEKENLEENENGN